MGRIVLAVVRADEGERDDRAEQARSGAATSSVVERASTKTSLRAEDRRAFEVPPISWAMIAPIRAMPTDPPTWRKAFSTAEPTPDLSTGSARTAAAALGVITSDIPKPPRIIAGTSVQ